jgi:polysaccharide biosynthesis protein PslH
MGHSSHLNMRRPKLLFLSPVIPVLSGQGLAMRAGTILEALARDFEIFLLVIPINPGPADGRVPPRIAGWCAAAEVLSVEGREDPSYLEVKAIEDPQRRAAAWVHYSKPSKCRFATPETLRLAENTFAGVRFDAVHVYRLYTVPFAECHLRGEAGARPRCYLDMDEHQSRVRRRVSNLCAAAGDWQKAALEESDASKYEEMERAYLPLFDRVLVSSARDAAEIASEYGIGNVSVAPNAVRIPETAARKQASAVFTLLFLGTLDYPPNEDGAVYFCSEVLPLLREGPKVPIRVVIAGLRPTAKVLGLRRHAEVAVAANVPEVDSYYENADAVVVPLRQGGGTRIKILEAASYRRPIVSTPAGADGLAVSDGEELLIGELPAEFAARCLALNSDPSLGERLAERAFGWVKRNHTVEAVREALLRAYGPIE